MQEPVSTGSNRNRRSDHPHPQDSDMDDSVCTTPSNHIYGPLHLPNNHATTGISSQLPHSINSLRKARTITTVRTATPAGETTKERPSKTSTTSTTMANPVIGPAAVLVHSNDNSNRNSNRSSKSNSSSNNEYDGTLTCDDDDEAYGHIPKGYVHQAHSDLDDELQDAVSILSDDNMFDSPTPSACCRVRNRRTLVCLLLLLCTSIITITVLAGVCSSGNCGNNNKNINATSLEFNNTGKLCNDKNISSSLSSLPSAPSPAACRQPQHPLPTLGPQYTTNSEIPIASPTYENVIPQKAFTSTQELYDAVDEYLATGISNPIYGRTIGSWNISLLTDLSNVFNAYDRNPRAMYFNDNLTGWDTSRVTTLENLFLNAISFNGDISTWQTGNVMNMHETFGRAISFNGDLSYWDVSKVTTMERLCESTLFFQYAYILFTDIHYEPY
jgi:surface protein